MRPTGIVHAGTGSPPRTGTRCQHQPVYESDPRITPAHGDETYGRRPPAGYRPDHPRARGRDSCFQALDFMQNLLSTVWLPRNQAIMLAEA